MTRLGEPGKKSSGRCGLLLHSAQREKALNIELLFSLPNMRYILRSVEYRARSGNEVSQAWNGVIKPDLHPHSDKSSPLLGSEL